MIVEKLEMQEKGRKVVEDVNWNMYETEGEISRVYRVNNGGGG